MQDQRFVQILDWLANHDFLGSSEAEKLLAVSPATIRRDFNELARRQFLERTRGGVRKRQNAIDGMSPFALREVAHAAGKSAIARHAAKLLRPSDVIIVDGGTTTFQLIGMLPNYPLRVITNSLRHAIALGEMPANRGNIEVLLSGGYFYAQAGILLGPQAAATLRNYQAHWAFLSAEGLGENGLSNTNEMVVEVERVMMAQAERTVVLADRSKFGRRSMCHLCNFDQIDILITDADRQSTPLLNVIERQGVEIATVSV